jgi:hypothetical protein
VARRSRKNDQAAAVTRTDRSADEHAQADLDGAEAEGVDHQAERQSGDREDGEDEQVVAREQGDGRHGA